MKNIIKTLVVIAITVFIAIVCYGCYMWYPYLKRLVDIKEQGLVMHSDEYVSSVIENNVRLDSIVDAQKSTIIDLTKKVDSLKVELQAERRSSKQVSEKVSKDLTNKIDTYIKSKDK